MNNPNNHHWNAYSVSHNGNPLLLGCFDSPVAAAECIEWYKQNAASINGVVPCGYEIRMEKACA